VVDVAVLRRWAWVVLFALGAILALLGLVVVDGSGGSIVLALGLLAIFGGAVRFISRGETGRNEPRVPAGHSGL
jgi:hypothetical protein